MNKASDESEAVSAGCIGVLLPPSLTEFFEIALARIVDLQKERRNVTAIVCNGVVAGCIANPLEIKGICSHCIKVREKAINAVAPNLVSLALKNCHKSLSQELPSEIEGEIQEGVLSTILTFYRRNSKSKNMSLFSRTLHKRLERSLKIHTVFVFNALNSMLEKGTIDYLEFFNGRIVPARGALLAARVSNKEFGVLEVSGIDRNLTVIRNNSVHDLYYKRTELSTFLRANCADLKQGTLFFSSRRGGRKTNDRSFTSKQKAGLIQRSEKKILSVFTSSADEVRVSAAQWFSSASLDPAPFIIKVADIISDDFEVIVRMHPNQAGDRTGSLQKFANDLQGRKGISVILPDSESSSYELLDQSDFVLTFGSTMGLEATYWEKTSILAGRAVWDQEGVSYNVEEPEEVALLLINDAVALDKQKACKIGSYYLTGTGKPGSISCDLIPGKGYSINGRNFLRWKRLSSFYWLSRIVNKIL